MKVRCINTESGKELVLNQIYEVIKAGIIFYTLEGLEFDHYKYCFEIVEE